MPIRPDSTLVIEGDQVIKLRLASSKSKVCSQSALSPPVYISGTPAGLSIGTSEPLCHRATSMSFVKGDLVFDYPGRVVYTSILRNLKLLATAAAVIAFAIGSVLGYALAAIGLVLATLERGVVTLIDFVADLMLAVQNYLVKPFTSFSLLYFSVVALRQYMLGQTVVLDRPFVVVVAYIAYTSSMTAVQLVRQAVVYLAERRCYDLC